MNKHYVLTLKAEERPGLLHLVTGILNRKLIPILSLTAAPTDIHNIILISMEISASEKALEPLVAKLENIIEVFAVEATPYSAAVCQRSAYFLLSREFMSSTKSSVVNRWEMQLVNLYENKVLFAKSGSEAVICRVYNELEGPYLLGFSQTGLIADTKLIGEDQSSVINWLAA
ncbi:MAG: hypothetical protein JST19_04365 [Bacteroidetes bacterium]|nr:hypothetical protein [Bacteroidota bacterium]